MKREKSITIGWEKLLNIPPINPKGYSTIIDISKKIGLGKSATHARISDLVKSGKLKRIRGRTEDGRIVWFYKD